MSPTSIQECPNFDDFGPGFEPRCRVWFQDVLASGNTDVIFTNPYQSVGSSLLTISSAAAVLNPAGDLLGVVGLDIDGEGIRTWISDLTVIDGQGYGYLLAPGGLGQVAIHKDLQSFEEFQDVFDLEDGFGDNEEEKAEFETLVAEMSAECRGTAEYDMGGEKWILAWKHETVSGTGASGSDNCGEGGFIAVVTVGEDVLLEVREGKNIGVSRRRPGEKIARLNYSTYAVASVSRGG